MFRFRRRKDKILLIDDDEVQLAHLAELIPMKYFDVITAMTGSKGIEIAREEQPEVILLDLEMPGKHGWRTLEELRADYRTDRIPVLIFSSNDDFKSMQRAFTSEAQGFILKPTNRNTLVRKIRKVLVLPWWERLLNKIKNVRLE